MMLIKLIRPTKIKDFFNSELQMYIYITVITSRWVLVHDSNTKVQINEESKGQGREGNKDLFWTLSALNFTVSIKPLKAIFRVPAIAL